MTEPKKPRQEAKWVSNAKLILAAFKQQDDYTIAELSDLLHLEHETMRATITKMCQQGLIQRIGVRNAGCRYERIENVNLIVPSRDTSPVKNKEVILPCHDEIHELFFGGIDSAKRRLESAEVSGGCVFDGVGQDNRLTSMRSGVRIGDDIWRYRGQGA